MVGRWKKELIIKDSENKYKFVNSAKVKDIRWDLMIQRNKSQLPSFEKVIKDSVYPEEYWRKKYPTEEDYKNEHAKFSTYAVLTPDGEWYEPGKMGWWGISYATPEEEAKFERNYEEKFIKTANPEWILTIVDCHI